MDLKRAVRKNFECCGSGCSRVSSSPVQESTAEQVPCLTTQVSDPIILQVVGWLPSSKHHFCGEAEVARALA